MKTAIFVVLAFCLSINSFSTFAQKNYSPGYVVHIDGDTTRGRGATVTVVVDSAVPPGPNAVSVKVVVVRGRTKIAPVAGRLPIPSIRT